MKRLKYKIEYSSSGWTYHVAHVGKMNIAIGEHIANKNYEVCLKYRQDSKIVYVQGSLKSAKQRVREEVKRYIRTVRCELREIWNALFDDVEPIQRNW